MGWDERGRTERETSWYFLKLDTDAAAVGKRLCAAAAAATGLAALGSVTQGSSGRGCWTSINPLEASGVL
jgi:hypothetical protein